VLAAGGRIHPNRCQLCDINRLLGVTMTRRGDGHHPSHGVLLWITPTRGESRVSAPDHDRLLEATVHGPVATGLACRRHEQGGCTVLLLSGEIDGGTAATLREGLESAIDEDRDKVVVDLSGVVFLDCSGIGELVQAMRRTGWTPGSICLARPTEPVRRVLDLTHVGTVCPVYDSVDAAVQARRGGGTGSLTPPG
jgi:anti-anti-sigma factor